MPSNIALSLAGRQVLNITRAGGGMMQGLAKSTTPLKVRALTRDSYHIDAMTE